MTNRNIPLSSTTFPQSPFSEKIRLIFGLKKMLGRPS